ncbi:MAG: HNH endonuclease signature motif containing protein, partial [Candidatus Phosphoribacter baldrii]
RLVRDRDGTCRFPGCNTPATHCDLDHAIPYPQGPTTPDNLHDLCRRHHGFKHHAGWTIHLDPDNATLTWTSPTGRTYTTHPHDKRDTAA